MAGLVAISFVLLIYVLMWNNISLRWNSINRLGLMQSSAYFASESLLSTRGEPESWEMLSHIDSNVSAIGLVNGRNEIDNLKIQKLVSENATAYSTIKSRLGLSQYEFGFRVTDLTENVVYYEFGKLTEGSLNNSVNFDRFALLNNSPVMFHMEVWGR
ncbi:MAG: hypothetical protein ACP5N9_04045 [Candidatus Bilamarchaeum sp.]|jgi:hypothetical protein